MSTGTLNSWKDINPIRRDGYSSSRWSELPRLCYTYLYCLFSYSLLRSKKVKRMWKGTSSEQNLDPKRKSTQGLLFCTSSRGRLDRISTLSLFRYKTLGDFILPMNSRAFRLIMTQGVCRLFLFVLLILLLSHLVVLLPRSFYLSTFYYLFSFSSSENHWEQRILVQLQTLFIFWFQSYIYEGKSSNFRSTSPWCLFILQDQCPCRLKFPIRTRSGFRRL